MCIVWPGVEIGRLVPPVATVIIELASSNTASTTECPGKETSGSARDGCSTNGLMVHILLLFLIIIIFLVIPLKNGRLSIRGYVVIRGDIEIDRRGVRSDFLGGRWLDRGTLRRGQDLSLLVGTELGGDEVLRVDNVGIGEDDSASWSCLLPVHGISGNVTQLAARSGMSSAVPSSPRSEELVEALGSDGRRLPDLVACSAPGGRGGRRR